MVMREGRREWEMQWWVPIGLVGSVGCCAPNGSQAVLEDLHCNHGGSVESED